MNPNPVLSSTHNTRGLQYIELGTKQKGNKSGSGSGCATTRNYLSLHFLFFLVVCPFPKLTLVSEWAVSLFKTVLKDKRLVIWRTVCASTVRPNGTRSLLVPLRHISLTIVKIFKRTFVLSGGSSPQNVCREYKEYAGIIYLCFCFDSLH